MDVVAYSLTWFLLLFLTCYQLAWQKALLPQ